MGASLSRRADEEDDQHRAEEEEEAMVTGAAQAEDAKATAEVSASNDRTANLVSPPTKNEDPNSDGKGRLQSKDAQAESPLLEADETKPAAASAISTQEIFVPRFLDPVKRHPLTRPMLEETFVGEIRSLTGSILSSDDWVGFSFLCKGESSDTLSYTISGRPKTVELVVSSLKTWLREYVRVLNCRLVADHGKEIKVWILPEAPVGIILKTFPRKDQSSGISFEKSRSVIPVQALRELCIAEINPSGIVDSLNGIPCHSIREFKKIKQLAASVSPSNSIPLKVRIIHPDWVRYLCHAPLLLPTGAEATFQKSPTRRPSRNQSNRTKLNASAVPADLLSWMNDAVSSGLEATQAELNQASSTNPGGKSLVPSNSKMETSAKDSPKPSAENVTAKSTPPSVPNAKTVKASFPASLDQKEGLVMCLFDVDDNFLKFRSKLPETTDWSGFSIESEAAATAEGQTLSFTISGPSMLVDAHVAELREYLRYLVIRYNTSIIEKHGVRKKVRVLTDPSRPLGAELSEVRTKVSLSKIDPDGQLGQALANSGTYIKDYPPCGIVESLADGPCKTILQFQGIMYSMTHKNAAARRNKKVLLDLDLTVVDPEYEHHLAFVPSLFPGAAGVNLKYLDRTKRGLVNDADADSEIGRSMENDTKPVATKGGSQSCAPLSGEKVASAKRALEPGSQGEAEQQANKRLKIEQGKGFGSIGTAFSTAYGKIRDTITEKLGPRFERDVEENG